jgi:hypothetical protein
MRGAPKDIADKQGKLPIDLVHEIKNESLQRELLAALQDEGSCDCLMLKTQLKKTERSMKMPILFLAFFDFIYAVLILLLFPVW